MSEVRKLSLHPLAIHTFIKAQAGSLAKALSEAVMNSVDAFATQVDINIWTTGFSIEDNGQGFQSKDEIAAWFETLGFPHDEGNHRQYGKFGMGRAQMWAFAKTTWKSNQFVMDVDVQKKGLDYVLSESPKPFKGTRIEAVFYQPQLDAQIESTLRELQSLVAYAPGLVMVNGKAFNRNPALESWTLETPEAWFLFDKRPSLAVYNAGILVSEFGKWRYGVGGVIVTKPHITLSLNLARNAVLEAECEVWPKLLKVIKDNEPNKASKEVKAAKPSEKTLQGMAKAVKAGTVTLEKALATHPELLVNVYGRTVPRWNMLSPVIAIVPKGDVFGKYLQKTKKASTLTKECVDRFDMPLNEFRALVEEWLSAYAQYRGEHYLRSIQWTEEPEKLFPDALAGRKVLTGKDLSKEVSVCLMAWRKVVSSIVRELRKVLTPEQITQLARLSLQAGDSQASDDVLWLEANSHQLVFRQKELVRGTGSPNGGVNAQYAFSILQRLLSIIGAEDGSDSTALFTRCLTETGLGSVLTTQLRSGYVTECRSRGIDFPVRNLAVLEAVGYE